MLDGRTDRPTDGQTLIKRCMDASKKASFNFGPKVWFPWIHISKLTARSTLQYTRPREEKEPRSSSALYFRVILESSNGGTNGPTDRWTDKAPYRDTWLHLRNLAQSSLKRPFKSGTAFIVFNIFCKEPAFMVRPSIVDASLIVIYNCFLILFSFNPYICLRK